MKRFTLFLALCLTMIGTALATLPTITDISQIDENKKYIISCSRGYLVTTIKTGETEAKLWASNQESVAKEFSFNDEAFRFQFKVVDGKSYLFSVSEQKYVNSNGSLSPTIELTETTSIPSINFNKQSDNTFLLSFSDGTYINIGGSNQIALNSWSTADAGNKMTITEVPDFVVEVTWEYYIESNKLYKTVQDLYAGNTECTAPAVDFFAAESQSDTNTGSEATKTITVNGHQALPFEVTTDLSSPKWYAVSLHTNQDFHLWHYDANDQLVTTPVPGLKAADYNVLSDNAYWWCFTGNLVDGFKIYNKKAGVSYTLNSTNEKATVGTAIGNNDLWTLVKSTSSIANSVCFKIKGGSDYINHQGGLKYWTSTDEGSSALFYTPASFPVNYVNSYINAPEGAIGGSKYLVGANKASAQEQIAAAEDDAMNFAPANTLAATCRAIDEVGFVEMTPGYYRVYSAQPGLYAKSKGLYLNSDGNDGNVRWGDVTASNAGNIFKFETSATEGKYEVFVCNAQKYLQAVTGTLGESTGTYTPVNVVSLGSAQFNLQMQELVTKADETTEVQTKTMHANGHYGGSGNEGNIIHWNGSANSASSWYLVPAKRFEVTLRTVDNASYATTYLPFAVEGDGVTKLYTGSLGDRVLNMNEVSGVIPAKTALVLKSATGAASTTLTISNDARSTVGANALQGTLSNIALNDDNRSNYLVLGKNEGKVGFYLPRNDAASIAANKAYLPNATASAIALNFDDVTTGIGQVATESENAPIFDLSGRRVNSAVKGGLYIQNGKKFIVK